MGKPEMGEPRNQFTFYRSYYDAIRRLKKKEQATIILAVCAYALYEEEPSGLSPVEETAFELIRPTIDSGRKKAESGKQGGSKPKAKGKQTAREKEKEKEGEKEIEIEVEKEGEPLASFDCSESFKQLLQNYPAHRVGNEAAVLEEFTKAIQSQDDAATALDSLDAWKQTDQWTTEAGKYIPSLHRWLSEGTWKRVPDVKPKGRQLDADEMAAIQRMMQE